MMKLKAFNFLYIFLAVTVSLHAQVQLTGRVLGSNTKAALAEVEVYNKLTGTTSYTTNEGRFTIAVEDTQTELVFIKYGYEITTITANSNVSKNLEIELKPLTQELTEIVIDQQKKEVFGIKNLKDVEGTSIYAGKKTEVVLVDQLVTNKASGNPRQAYAQVSGLNIFETEDAGLQLNIGGRGLDPNRSSNFNTRQNGYDISADVLGYPESYYSPSLEALDEIQIIRGAASLQYGTQFGGLVNFKLKQPHPTKKFELISRTGVGSFGLLNTFNSFSGTVDKVSYYAFHQYKKGNGFRPNSEFESHNIYGNLGYRFSKKTKLNFESTYLTYLAQQAGGLTDQQFEEDPYQSNRPRNYFAVDWLLLNLKLEHDFSTRTKGSINFFHLNAFRKALGFNPVRITVTDDDFSVPRELLANDFKNWGAEARLLTRYKLFKKNNVFLIGAKYYQAANEAQQGNGNSGSRDDFGFYDESFPNSAISQFQYDYPNLNVSVFGENIFRFTDQFSVTPGFRFEYIKTGIDGFFNSFTTNAANNVIATDTTLANNERERSFVLLGVGLSYKPANAVEVFANFSQNYRSVTFSDLLNSQSITVDENLQDETGFTADLGVRGNIENSFRYDANVFALFYDNRIGVSPNFIESPQDRRLRRVRSNIGAAEIYGIESLVTANLSNWLLDENTHFHWQHFLNTSYTYTQYTEAAFSNSDIAGNELEFAPDWNIKTGVELGYKDFKSSLQYTYVTSQFTDFENTFMGENQAAGITGLIPGYDVLDFSAEYTYKKFKLEAGVNNLLNEAYFTRRATGYPGPGIIPSAPRNVYAVLQVKL